MSPDVDLAVIVAVARPAHHRLASQVQLLPFLIIEEELVGRGFLQIDLMQPGCSLVLWLILRRLWLLRPYRSGENEDETCACSRD